MSEVSSDVEETEHKFSAEVLIPKKNHKFIVGKCGDKIKKIRRETNTIIEVPLKTEKSDVIVIYGRDEDDVLEAKEKILEIQEELDRAVTEDIIIPAELHSSIIGDQGRGIVYIIARCKGVRINFPKRGIGSDKVSIYGAEELVLEAKERLLETANEKQLSRFTAKIKANPELHTYLIGRKGVAINKISKKTGARIAFPNKNDLDKSTITISGKKEEVEAAKAELNTIIEELKNTAELIMDIDPKHHRHFVTKGAEVLTRISNDYGGVAVSFPKKGSSSSKVVLKGNKDFLIGAKQRLQEVVKELEAMVTFECVIPQEHHRTILGKKGSKVKSIQRQYNVTIKFPDRERAKDSEEVGMDKDAHSDVSEEETNQRDIIIIKGKLENCKAAAKALKDSVPVAEEMEIKYDHRPFIIGEDGDDIISMMETYDVNIYIPPPDEESDVITIKGPPENIAKAKEALRERIEELELGLSRGFQLTVEVDPQYHPKIIGRRGEFISKIREDHRVQIKIPDRDSDNDREITITGSEEDAEAAKEAILKWVQEQENAYKEEVSILHRFHSRIIGSQGHNIFKIKEKFRVDIHFPKSSDPDPDVLIIQGDEEDVQFAKAHLLNLEEEYLRRSQLRRRMDRRVRGRWGKT